MPIFSSWVLRTIAVKIRSVELVTLDGAVEALATRGPGAKDVNILKGFTDFTAWKTARPVEVAALGDAVDELESDIREVYWKGKSQLTNTVATGVMATGWKYVAFDPTVQTFTTALPQAEQVNPTFSTAETMRMNEAIRRVKLAIKFARDAMIKIGNNNASANELQAYTDFFGVVDVTRMKRITDNFKVLSLAFDDGPDMVDLRNTVYGKQVYAACFRRSLATTVNGTLSLTGKVNMFLGRAFFARGNYEKTSDATVSTLVHEFAHGAINAVDVPPVDAMGGWTRARSSDDPTSTDFGASTDNMIQASTIPMDKLLAQFKPDYALVNADSYGQFATRLLLDNRG